MSKDSKVTNLASLRQVEKSTGRRPKDLNGPDCPEEARYVWEWFIELQAGRGSNGFGPSALSHVEIAAWADLKRVTLSPWEVRAIRNLDVAYLQAYAEGK